MQLVFMRWMVKHRVSLVLWAVYACLSFYTLSYYMQISLFGDRYYQVNYDTVMAGKAWKPFAYRLLFPQLVLAIDTVTPPGIQQDVTRAVEELKTAPDYVSLREFLPWLGPAFPNPASHYKRFVAAMLMYATIVLYSFMMYRLGQALFPDDRAVSCFAPIFAMLALTSFSHPILYLYDFPSAMFSAMLLYLMYKQRYRAYMLVFSLACLNKETALFIIVFFALWNFNRLPSRRFALLLSLQAFIYISIKAIITLNFMGNSGVFLDSYTTGVLERDLFAVADTQKIISFCVLFFLLTYHWDEKPLLLKYSLWLIPMYFIAYILYGKWNEYRVFIDIHPPLVLLATHTLVAGTGITKSPAFARYGGKKHAPHP